MYKRRQWCSGGCWKGTSGSLIVPLTQVTRVQKLSGELLIFLPRKVDARVNKEGSGVTPQPMAVPPDPIPPRNFSIVGCRDSHTTSNVPNVREAGAQPNLTKIHPNTLLCPAPKRQAPAPSMPCRGMNGVSHKKDKLRNTNHLSPIGKQQQFPTPQGHATSSRDTLKLAGATCVHRWKKWNVVEKNTHTRKR